MDRPPRQGRRGSPCHCGGRLGPRARRDRPSRAGKEGAGAVLREDPRVSRRAMHEGLHREPRPSRATRAGARLFPRHRQRRAGPVRDAEESRARPSGRRARRPREREGAHRRRRRPDGVSRPEVELPGRRPVRPHVLGDRDARSRDSRDERRDVPRHDRAARHDPDAADQGRTALGRPLREVRGARGADARRLRDWRGSDHAVPRGVTDSGRDVRVGRDGRVSRRAGRAGPLRDRGSRGAGERGDRLRGIHQRRSRDVRARRPVRGVHRLRVRPPHAATDDEDHLHHASQRSHLQRLARRDSAGVV